MQSLIGFLNWNRAFIVDWICSSSFLGHFEERVRQYQVVDSVHSWISLKLRINVEEHLPNPPSFYNEKRKKKVLVGYLILLKEYQAEPRRKG